MILYSKDLVDQFNLPWRPTFKKDTLAYVESVKAGNYSRASKENNITVSTLLRHVSGVMQCYCLDQKISFTEAPNFKIVLAENFQDVIRYIKENLVDENNEHIIPIARPYFSKKDIKNIINQKIYTVEVLQKKGCEIVFKDGQAGVWGSRLRLLLPHRTYTKAIEVLECGIEDKQKLLLLN